jgi:hypothetical protein
LLAEDRMKRFIEGTDRAQSTLFPEYLEDGIDEDNPVRVNGNFKNGDWTAEAIEERKWLRSLVRSLTKTEITR